MRQTVVAGPTAYDDPDEARRAVMPYVRDMGVRDMGVRAAIIVVRDTEPSDG